MENKYIDEILNNNTIFYAHTKEGSSSELLSAHLKLTLKYYNKLEKIKKLDDIVKSMVKTIYKDISDSTLNKVYDIFKSSIYYHDIGKINPAFQKEKMNNNIGNYESGADNRHSNLSAKIFVDATIKDIIDNNDIYGKDESFFLIYITLYFGCMISRHHTPLKNISNYIDDILKVKHYDMYKEKISQNIYDMYFSNTAIEEFIEKYNIDKISIYILNKLLYSCIVTSDYYATYEYMNQEEVCINDKKNSKLFERYEDSILFKSIKSYQEKTSDYKGVEGINILRNDMFLEVEHNLKENLDKNIFYLEAPTGAGKTNIAINIAKILYENNRDITSINYIFPFNNLIEQTKNTFNNYFSMEGEEKTCIVINSVTPILNNSEIEKLEENDKLNYNEEYIKNIFRMYPIKITSHVNLFTTLFGTTREANYNLYDLVNSVVIIDEIQSYSNKIWREIIIMLDKYASALNIKFIIMSATLPRLDYLLKEEKTIYYNLIKNSNIYKNNKIFKERVMMDFSLLNEELTLEKLAKQVLSYKGKKILIEFIKKKTARDFYNIIKEKGIEVYELTGDDNKFTRNKILEKIKNKKDIIVVATQTIEAGVDIDMDIGFKNISFLDSEEQFLGRINRSSKKTYECKAYFFLIDEPKSIYKDDIRLEFTLKEEKMRKILVNKEFDEYYNKVMERTYEQTNKNNENNIVNLNDSCGKINYKYIEEKIKLINTKNIQIFLNYTIDTIEEKIIGSKIWNEYKELCSNNSIQYTKKKIDMSRLYEKMDLFTYNLMCKDSTDEPSHYTEKFANMYYIENGKDFIIDGKFDREKYNKCSRGMFL